MEISFPSEFQPPLSHSRAHAVCDGAFGLEPDGNVSIDVNHKNNVLEAQNETDTREIASGLDEVFLELSRF